MRFFGGKTLREHKSRKTEGNRVQKEDCTKSRKTEDEGKARLVNRQFNI
jgi:hypothetical protein